MRRLKQRTYILLACGALFMGVAVVLSGWGARTAATPTSAQLYSASYWQERINAVGGPAAYEELAASVARLNANDSHRLAHIFGTGLYRAKGLSGISVCDSRFIYGCFHQFTAEAIAAEGLSVIRRIGTLCGTDDQCFHGAGHGALAFLGYNLDALTQVSDACALLPPHNLFSGCLGGVFMEYDLRTMLGVWDPRTIAPDDPKVFYPCDNLDATTAPTCYYWQAQVWKLSWKDDMSAEQLFTRMGALCSTLTSGNRKACMAGIGAAAISVADYEVDRLAAACGQAAHDSDDLVLCNGSAAKAVEGAVSHAQAERLCAHLSDPQQSSCLRYVNTPNEPASFRP